MRHAACRGLCARGPWCCVLLYARTFTVPKIEAWIQQPLQTVTNHPALEVQVLTQGPYPGVGEALVSLADRRSWISCSRARIPGAPEP